LQWDSIHIIGVLLSRPLKKAESGFIIALEQSLPSGRQVAASPESRASRSRKQRD
jgi:hypothetical protein